MNKQNTGLKPRIGYNMGFPTWSQPKPVGYFSIDTNRCYCRDHSQLRVYREPGKEEYPLELNAGVESAIRKPESQKEEGIRHLLEFIRDNYDKIINSFKKDDAQKRKQQPLFPIAFVGWRGLLRLIMCTPSEFRENWIIKVTKYKGTYYLCQKETEEAKHRRQNETRQQRNMCSWGYKFEQYCLTTPESPTEKPKTDVPVDECSEFSCVFTTNVEGHNLLYGAEIDGIKTKQPLTDDCELDLRNLELIELKTSLRDMNSFQRNSFACYKIRNWWCQAFLVGIKKIIVGWRDQSGKVLSVEEMSVHSLNKHGKKWTASQCAGFLVSFLDCVNALMAKVDSPHTVYEFTYDAKNARIMYELFTGHNEKSFLPNDYIEFIENLSKSS